MLQITTTTIALIGFMLATIALALLEYIFRQLKNINEPFKLPIIGHLYLLGRNQVPYEDFTELSKKYGQIYKLQLGSYKCVIVHGQENIRQVLITDGHHFDSRPNFQRYHQLFAGNKDNSLAFCDWSQQHKLKRDMLKRHTFPHSFTINFLNLEQIISENCCNLLSSIERNKFIQVKPLILYTCANIFVQHFCSKTFKATNQKFTEMIQQYDEIFYEVNQGYAADFLPFLLQPFHGKNLAKIELNTHKIRQFVNENIIENRFESFTTNVKTSNKDYVETLIDHVKEKDSSADLISWESALFALEDIIGGHSAVGNFLIKALAFIAMAPNTVQTKIQDEIEKNVGNNTIVTINHRSVLPYTEATIYEAIRLIASPIVPRVANKDTKINHLSIEENTIVFLNNHELNMSEKLWNEPHKFEPERFIRNGRLFKPEHFLPFGGGRRSCMGYKMVQLISFNVLANLMQHFYILPQKCQIKVPVGCLALPKNTFQFKFVPRF